MSEFRRDDDGQARSLQWIAITFAALFFVSLGIIISLLLRGGGASVTVFQSENANVPSRANLNPNDNVNASTGMNSSSVSPLTTPEADANGLWEVKYKFNSGGGGNRFDLRINVKGDKVSMSHYDYVGSARGSWYPLAGARLKGNKITFYFSGQGERTTYSGVIEGDTMSGTINSGQGSWRARRK